MNPVGFTSETDVNCPYNILELTASIRLNNKHTLCQAGEVQKKTKPVDNETRCNIYSSILNLFLKCICSFTFRPVLTAVCDR